MNSLTGRWGLRAIGAIAVVLVLGGVSGFAYQTQTASTGSMPARAGEGAGLSGGEQHRDGKRHGFGRVTWANGNAYAGEWRDGVPHGRGRFTVPDGGYHEGEWRDGWAEGIGVAQWSNGARYEGEWRGGRLEGLGTFISAGGNRYDGEWRDTKMSGRGRAVWPGGASYDGEWQDDWPHGQGTYVSKGVAYTGIWKGGCLKVDGQLVAIGRPRAECGSLQASAAR